MIEKKYVVPEGMMKAFIHAENHSGTKWDEDVLKSMLTAALRWLAENPIVPNHAQVQEVQHANIYYTHEFIKFCVEWQRRMFLASEPDIPEAVKDLVEGWSLAIDGEAVQRDLVEAYRRGRESR